MEYHAHIDGEWTFWGPNVVNSIELQQKIINFFCTWNKSYIITFANSQDIIHENEYKLSVETTKTKKNNNKKS